LAKGGKTVFCTTHNMDEAEELCNRIAILDQGKTVEIDTPEGFKTRYAEPVLHAMVQGPDGRETLSIRLDREEERAFLAETIRLGRVVSIQSDSISLKDVFLRLTGRAFH
jgi:ABC-type multidrug transport system ATPase subunit